MLAMATMRRMAVAMPRMTAMGAVARMLPSVIVMMIAVSHACLLTGV